MADTASGIAAQPIAEGSALNIDEIVSLADLSVDGFTVGTLVYVRAEGEFFCLQVSSDVVDHTTVEAVSGYDDLRWILFQPGGGIITLSGDVTGIEVDGDIAATLHKIGGVTITATGTALMTAATAAAARTTLAVDILKAGTNLTDANQTLQPFTDRASQYTQAAASLTANRTKTLGTTTVVTGTVVTIIRRDLTANTIAVVNGGAGAGTLLTFGASPTSPEAATFYFDGTNWSLISFFYVTA